MRRLSCKDLVPQPQTSYMATAQTDAHAESWWSVDFCMEPQTDKTQWVNERLMSYKRAGVGLFNQNYQEGGWILLLGGGKGAEK